jgi:hypothetical protein
MKSQTFSLSKKSGKNPASRWREHTEEKDIHGALSVSVKLANL